MLKASLLKPADYIEQKWKNGLGVTTQLLVDANEPIRWRLSSAKVEGTQKFSVFPGYDRTLVVLSGGPLTLNHSNGKQRTVKVGSPYAFSGEWDTVGTALTPVTDFNLFCLRGTAKGTCYISTIGDGEELQFPIVAKDHFLYGIAGAIRVEERNGGETVSLLPGELFRLQRTGTKEYLNIKVVGTSESQSGSVVLWLPLHY